MNNTQITQEPRYPFVPMFANGLPQADFYVNGITAPVLISPRSASDDTRHEWTGYLKIMKRGTYFLSLDADSSISLSIPFKNVELTSEAKDLSVKPESVVLEQGYYWCQIVHEYHPPWAPDRSSALPFFPTRRRRPISIPTSTPM